MNSLRQMLGLLALPVYFLATIAIGWMTRPREQNASAFLNASRSIPLWVVVAAYLAANCGALEIVGLSAMAAQYGVAAFHFYWAGAVPALIFLGLWMMPVYRRSNVRSMPEYLELRFGPGLRLLNATVVLLTLLLLAGVSLYAMTQVLVVLLRLGFLLGILLSAGIVLAYVLLGGLRATIYNEVLQLAVIIAGLAPLFWRSVHRFGSLQAVQPGLRLHLWKGLPLASTESRLDVLGIVVGLGFVLSFGYWCTDFVQMQRAFTARTELEAREVPLWAGFGKLLFSLLVVVPGLYAFQAVPALGHQQRFDQALPALMTRLYGPVMLGVGLTALTASLMSGLAANVSAVGAIWTEDIYRAHLRPGRSDKHYLLIGRLACTVAVIASLFTSLINFLFSNLMEHVQLIFAVFGSPFWAVFLLGTATRRADARGATLGFIAGTGISLLHLVLFARGVLHYGSVMSANFHAAIYAFAVTILVGIATSGKAKPAVSATSRLVWNRGGLTLGGMSWRLWLLSATLLATCAALNYFWR